MVRKYLWSLRDKFLGRTASRKSKAKLTRYHRPLLEGLEERVTPTVYTKPLAGDFQILFTGADNITVTVNSGNVYVNGSNTGVAASSVTSLTIRPAVLADNVPNSTSPVAATDADNVIDISAVTAASFGALNSFTVDGGGNGSAVGDSVTLPDEVQTVTINAAGGGTFSGAGRAFSNIENLTGSTANDVFDVADNGSLAGTLSGNGAVTTDELSFSAYTLSDITVNVTSANTGNVTKNNPTPSIIINQFTGIQDVTGSTLDDTFAFADGASLDGAADGAGGVNTLSFAPYTSGLDINVTGLNTGDVTSVLGSFTAFQNLTGGHYDDTFTFGATASIAGDLSSGGGLDELDLSASSTAITVTLTASNNNGVDGSVNSTIIGGTFTDIATIDGSLTAAGDKIIGMNTDSDWYITNANEGYVDNLDFSNIENLTGGSGSDKFTIDPSASVSGAIDGGGGSTNELDYATDNFGSVAVTLTSTGTSVGFNGTANGVTGGFSNINKLTAGNNGSDQLTGIDAASTWDVNDGTGNGGVYTSTKTFTFVGVNNLVGGSNDDTFNVTANHAGNISGGGNSTLDTYNFSGSAALTGNVNGSTGADSFSFSGTASVSGDVNGSGGGDTLSFASYGSARNITLTGVGSSAGFNGTDASTSKAISGSFKDISTLIGSGNSNETLQGINNVANWGLNSSGANTYSATNTLNFSAFENLTGGSSTDSFNFGPGASVLGNIDGGASTGNDTLNYSGYSSAVAVALSGTGGYDGFNGSSTAVGGTFSNIDTLTGSTATDSLTGINAAATWAVNNGSSNGGTYTSIKVLTYTGVENLIGNAAVDTFNVTANHTGSLYGMGNADVFTLSGAATTLTGSIYAGDDNDSINIKDTASVTGKVFGDGGTNTLSYNGYTGGAITMNRATGTTTATGGFVGIDSLVGSTNTGDTLIGLNTSATWNVTDNNSGNVDTTFTFSAVENLTGGTGADTFIFSDGKSVTGKINGSGGSDKLDFSAYIATNALTVNITTSNGGDVSSTPANFDFSSIEDIDGGAGDDKFIFSNRRSISGTIDGKGGSDTFDFNSYTRSVSVTLTGALAGTSSGGDFANIEKLIGGSRADTLTGQNAASTWNITDNDVGNITGSVSFKDFENLTGGSNNDEFVFGAGKSVSGRINGGNGTDKLNYSAYTTAVAVNLAASSATGTAGISSIETVAGSSTANGTLTGANTANSWTISGTNSGTLNSVGFSNINNLVGGSGTDSFTYSGGSVSSINGGAGSDTIIASAVSADITADITSNNGGTLAGGVAASFSAVENLTTGAGNDVFNLSNGQGLSGAINAGAGQDTLNYGAYTSGVFANLGTGAATNINGGAISGVSGIENVIGGSGNDSLTGDNLANVLIGNAGNDTLTGGDGNDILIGGAGADSLNGGNGIDLLFGGYTSFDNSIGDLNSLIADWNTGAATSATAAKAGVTDGNGTQLILSGTGQNVINDSSVGDQLTGGGADDWFIFSYNDILNDAGGTDLTDFMS